MDVYFTVIFFQKLSAEKIMLLLENNHRHSLQIKCFIFVAKTVQSDQELISYRYSSYSCSSCCCWGDLFKKDQRSVVSSGIRMKLGRVI